MYATIGIKMDEFEQGLSNASKKFFDFSKNIESAGKKVSDIGSSLTTKITLPLGGLAVAATKMSMDFEGAMAKVATIADTTSVPIGTLQSAIINLSNETGIAAGDIANSVYNVISATGDTAGAVELVSNATKLATAGFTNSESALSVLTTAINAYGLSSEQAAKISDSLIMTQNLGVTTVADLASNMGRAIATASAYGVSLENLETGYVSLTKGGISTAESTTYLSSMMNELGKAGGNVSKILLEQTGMSFGQLMESGMSLGDVLGILYESTGRNSEGFINLWSSAEAGKAANAIVNQGLEEFNANLQTISGSMGATQSAYDTMQTSSFNLGKAINELKNAAIQFGDVLMPVLVPALTAVVEKATELVRWFTDLDSGTQSLILTIGGIAIAAGPVLTVAGNIITAVGKISGGISSLIGAVTNIGSVAGTVVGAITTGLKALWGVMLANPIAAVIAAVAALTAGIVVLWNTNEDFRNAVGAIWEAIKGFFVGAWEAIQTAWSTAGEFFGSIVESIKGVFDGIGEFLGGLFTEAWEMVQGAWEAAKEFFSGIADGIHEVFESVTSFLGDAFRSAWDAVSGAWEAATGFFGDIWDNISGAAKKSGEAVGKAFKGAWDALKSAWDGAISFFSGIAQNIVGVFSDIGGKFLNIGRNIVDGIKNGIAGAWDAFMGWLNNKVGGIVDGVKRMLGIHSPSTVFAGIGGNMALGLAAGWDDEYNGIKRKIESGLSFGTASVGVNANYSGSSRYGSQEAAGRPGGWGNTTVNIYSPEAVDGAEAARVWKKETQKMAIAYV